MNADPKPKPHKREHDRSKRSRRHQEEALDDALKNTFPASDPFSIEQPAPPDEGDRSKAMSDRKTHRSDSADGASFIIG
jgi:hypothetical protein